jgi:hypothetical protein
MRILNFSLGLSSIALITSLFFGCDIVDSRVKVINTTSRVVYYKCMPDSSYSELFNEIRQQKESFKDDSLAVRRYFKEIRPEIDTISEAMPGSWDKYFDKPGIKIWIFTIPDSLIYMPVRSIEDIKSIVKTRKDYDKSYLTDHHWVIGVTE